MADAQTDAVHIRDENARIWEHCVHEDAMRFQRSNLFLVAQTLLVVGYTTLVSAGIASGHHSSAARVVASFGLLLTFIWLYVGHRHARYTDALRLIAAERMPAYAAIHARCRPRGPSGWVLVTYALPGLAGVMWILLLLIN
ncbi:RipA family octameric membrane protein [Streptomyces umbrinus]|uniref:RipA family octameric membrane protein n=1 Tax=Streptomyces umbrinus TaxID=67370 RepID=UPI003F4D37FC